MASGAMGENSITFTILFILYSAAPSRFHFLKEMATDRVRDDIKDELRRLGVEKKLISLNLMIGFYKSRLVCDENLARRH